jgi:hypothetical protein
MSDPEIRRGETPGGIVTSRGSVTPPGILAPTWIVAAGVAAILLAALAIADTFGRSDREILGAWSPLLGGGLDWGRLGAFFVAARLPLLVGLLAYGGLRFVRAGGIPERPLLGTSLGIAGVGQSFLMLGSPWLGIVLYGFASLLWWIGPRVPTVDDDAVPVALEVSLSLLIFAGVALVCVIQLDVDPPIHVDEMAYAARLRLGEVAADVERLFPVFGIYDFGHFRAQAIPFALQSAGVAVLGPGVLALRLVSAAAALVALALAYTTSRRVLGVRVALLGLALAGFAPLLLTSARYGHMISISISILHGVVSLTLLVRLLEMPSRGRAAWLGLVAGASFYFYQVSWFVPVLCALVLLVTGRVGLRGQKPELVLVSVATALVAIAPGALLLRSDFEILIGRTLGDRGVWSSPAGGPGAGELGLVVATGDPFDRAAMGDVVTGLREEGLGVFPMVNARGSTALALTGDTEIVGEAMEGLGLDSRNVVVSGGGRGVVSNARDMLAELFAKPHIEFGLRLADVPILNPVVAPLVVLGLIEALRRRKQLAIRALLVWVVGGALLPAMFASVAPRRAVLMLPFVQILAALPLVELLRARQGPGGTAPFGRVSTVVLGAIVTLVAIVGYASGTWATFERRGGELRIWREADPDLEVVEGAPETSGSILELAKRLKSLPPGEVVRIAPMYPLLDAYLSVLEESGTPGIPERAKVDPRADGVGKIRRTSCNASLPIQWLTRSSLRTDAAHTALAEAFEFSEDVSGPWWWLRIEATRGDACRRAKPRRR